MTTTLTPNAPQLREAFYALSMAKRMPDAELLDEVVRRYPQFADEIIEFAIALALDSLRGEAAVEAAEAAIDPTKVSPSVSRALSRFHNRLHAVHKALNTTTVPSEPVCNPLSGLGRQQFRAFAERIGANTVLAAKLRDRQIDPDTMTDGFKRLVADELRAPLDVVVAHFAAKGGAVGASRQFYKADQKPSHDQRQSFADALRSSGLTDEQQQRLLSL